jgi:hypothetical protein
MATITGTSAIVAADGLSIEIIGQNTSGTPITTINSPGFFYFGLSFQTTTFTTLSGLTYDASNSYFHKNGGPTAGTIVLSAQTPNASLGAGAIEMNFSSTPQTLNPGDTFAFKIAVQSPSSLTSLVGDSVLFLYKNRTGAGGTTFQFAPPLVITSAAPPPPPPPTSTRMNSQRDDALQGMIPQVFDPFQGQIASPRIWCAKAVLTPGGGSFSLDVPSSICTTIHSVAITVQNGFSTYSATTFAMLTQIPAVGPGGIQGVLVTPAAGGGVAGTASNVFITIFGE